MFQCWFLGPGKMPVVLVLVPLSRGWFCWFQWPGIGPDIGPGVDPGVGSWWFELFWCWFLGSGGGPNKGPGIGPGGG